MNVRTRGRRFGVGWVVLLCALAACDEGPMNPPAGLPGPASGTAVSIQLCPLNAKAIWFAFQYEGGPWTPVSSTAPNTYAFLTTHRFAVVIVFETNLDFGAKGYSTRVAYLTLDDVEPINGVDCRGDHSIQAEVTGVAASDVAIVHYGSFYRFAWGGGGVSLGGLPGRPLDVVVARHPNSAADPPDLYLIRRDIDPASGEPFVVLDFGGGEAFAPMQVTYSAGNVSSGTLWSFGLRTAAGTWGSVMFEESVGPFVVQAFPADRLADDDRQEVRIREGDIVGGGPWRSVSALQRVAVGGQVVLGPWLASAIVTMDQGQLHVRVPVQPEYDLALEATLFDPDGARGVWLFATASYLNPGAEWDVPFPQLEGVSGWTSAWGPEGMIPGPIAAFGGYVDLGGVPADGTFYRAAGTGFVDPAQNIFWRPRRNIW